MSSYSVFYILKPVLIATIFCPCNESDKSTPALNTSSDYSPHNARIFFKAISKKEFKGKQQQPQTVALPPFLPALPFIPTLHVDFIW
jgi:hypothetical protein